MVYLYDIEVALPHRQKGIASALVRRLLEDCDADGADWVWAGTEATNKAARKTFETTKAVLVGDAYVEYEWDLES